MKYWENADWEKEQEKIPYILVGIMIFVIFMAVFMYFFRKFIFG